MSFSLNETGLISDIFEECHDAFLRLYQGASLLAMSLRRGWILISLGGMTLCVLNLLFSDSFIHCLKYVGEVSRKWLLTKADGKIASVNVG